MYKNTGLNNFCFFKKNYILLFFLSLIFFSFFLVKKINNIILKKFKNNNYSLKSITPVNIQIITRIKNPNKANYIQNIYINKNQNNKLIVLIKPNIWIYLNKKEKDDLLKEISNIWKDIYLKNNPDSLKKTEVIYSNIN